jgi:type II secretory pathway pseudopilin PulG
MRTARRPGVTLLDLLAVLAVLAVLGGLFFPAVQMVRGSADRMKSLNNLKQIGLAVHNHESVNQFFPSGNDANNFSAAAHLLPYLEQDNLYRRIDFTKPATDPANAAARAARIPTYLSPRDPRATVTEAFGATNYLYSAGSKLPLKDNNGVFFQDSKQKIVAVSDGTSNTVMAAETLKGDFGEKAVTVQRQHIRLKAGAQGGEGDQLGVADFRDGKNVAGDRCASWMVGQFLQGTFNGTLAFNAPRPDVDLGGEGGLSALRSPDDHILMAMCDGSVRSVSARRVSLKTWQIVTGRDDGMVTPGDWDN